MFLAASAKDFDALADSVAQDFMAGKGSLPEVLVARAKSLALNPMEIRRLTEKANSLAMVKLLQVSKDKKVEFDIAEPADIIKQVYAADAADAADKDSEEQETLSEKTASWYELPDLRSKDIADKVDMSSLQKVADTEDTPVTDQELQRQIFRFGKKKEELYQVKIATELKFHDNVDYLLTEFSKVNAPDFFKFAADVSAISGEIAAPFINALAAALNEDVSDLEKTASLVDDSAPRYSKVAECLSYLKEISDLDKELVKVSTELDGVWEEVVKRGNN